MLKLLLIGLLCFGITKAENSVKSHGIGTSIADIINGMITELLEKMKALLPDPIRISKINKSFNGTALNGSFAISDLLELGLRDFEVKNVETRLLSTTLNVVLNFADININTNYDADMLAGTVVPIYGGGPLNLRLKNLGFNLTSRFTFKLLKRQLKIQNTTFITTLDDAIFDVHGIIDNEAFSILCSQIFNDTFTIFINKHQKLISSITSPVIEAVVNSILTKKKSKKLFSSPTGLFEDVDMTGVDSQAVDKLLHTFLETLVSQYNSLDEYYN